MIQREGNTSERERQTSMSRQMIVCEMSEVGKSNTKKKNKWLGLQSLLGEETTCTADRSEGKYNSARFQVFRCVVFSFILWLFLQIFLR